MEKLESVWANLIVAEQTLVAALNDLNMLQPNDDISSIKASIKDATNLVQLSNKLLIESARSERIRILLPHQS